ncbi:MAG: prephenate dehydratase domain-containing protein [Gemmatimonadaceae bacterium]
MTLPDVMTHDAATTPRVTFQGEAGAYGEDAVVRRWGEDARPLPARTFAEALTRVAEGGADCAVIPVWNSTIGDVTVAIAALAGEAARLVVVDDLLVPVRHCLLALPGTALGDVRHVGSHPAALGQCTRFLGESRGMVGHEAYDTGGAARELAELAELAGPVGDAEGGGRGGHGAWYDDIVGAEPGRLAVIASARAAARHGLDVLLADIQDDPANATRFAIVRPREIGRW